MESEIKKVEAILFTTGRFMEIEEVARLCHIGSLGYVKTTLEELKKNYERKDTALEIQEENGKWKLNIKKEYNYLTTNLLSDSEFDRPTTQTLAIIAYKQPVMQSGIIEIRGNSAYDHIKTLRENKFITSEKKGRTRLLKLTSKFFDYFDVVEEELKDKIESQIPEEIRSAPEELEDRKEAEKEQEDEKL